MRLILTNGYPYPYPLDATEAQQEALTEASASHRLELAGVATFQWLHTVTVEFRTDSMTDHAAERTGWTEWCARVLEAKTSSGDGYDHPAIIVNDMAYCGFLLVEG